MDKITCTSCILSLHRYNQNRVLRLSQLLHIGNESIFSDLKSHILVFFKQYNVRVPCSWLIVIIMIIRPEIISFSCNNYFRLKFIKIIAVNSIFITICILAKLFTYAQDNLYIYLNKTNPLRNQARF